VSARADIRVLALDLDGTVLGPGNRLAPRAVAAVAAFRATGRHVVIASGRSRRSALPWALGLGGAGGMICHNGAAVYDFGDGAPEEGKLIAETLLPEPTSRRLVELSRKLKLHFHGFVGDDWLYERTMSGTAIYEARSGFEGRRVDFDALPRLGFHKAMFIGEQGQAIEEAAVRARKLSEGSATVLFSGPGFLEIVAAGVSKAVGLRAYLERLGLGLKQVLAIGDADNDEEMLLAAGIGVAMGDAPEAMRARVGRVTGSFAEDGAAAAIEAFLAGRL
jgi:Cof subfamily protein (haloacid dehalogenase superfamily)